MSKSYFLSARCKLVRGCDAFYSNIGYKYLRTDCFKNNLQSSCQAQQDVAFHCATMASLKLFNTIKMH